jgi:class 3 adenylate cyclase
MLFADVSGYSALTDAQIPAFVEHVLGPLGTRLAEFTGDLRYVNTWGDAIFAVLDSVTVAAECALALQSTMRSLDLAAAGLPETVALRIGGHAGPVFSRTDPIRGDTNFYGDAVTRAARIEPRTPVGEVYVTHPFAALIALEAPADLACQYVGRLPAAKAYGTFPMYLLTKVNPEA